MNTPIDLQNLENAFKHKSNKDLKFSIFIFKLLNNVFLNKFLILSTKLFLKLNLPVSYFIKKTILHGVKK